MTFHFRCPATFSRWVLSVKFLSTADKCIFNLTTLLNQHYVYSASKEFEEISWSKTNSTESILYTPRDALAGSVPFRPSCVTFVSTLPDSNTYGLTSSQPGVTFIYSRQSSIFSSIEIILSAILCTILLKIFEFFASDFASISIPNDCENMST